MPDEPHRLSVVIENAKKIYDKYRREVILDTGHNDALAQLLGYKSANNGAYHRALRIMRAFGLIEGKKDVRISALCQKILYGLEDERKQAMLEAFLSIPLYKTLYDRYRTSLPSQNFWHDLQRITGCDPKEAQEKEGIIRRYFAKDSLIFEGAGEQRLTISRGPPSTEDDAPTDSDIRRTDALANTKEEAARTQEGTVLAILVKEGAFDIAKNYIDFLKQRKIADPDRPEQTTEEKVSKNE